MEPNIEGVREPSEGITSPIPGDTRARAASEKSPLSQQWHHDRAISALSTPTKKEGRRYIVTYPEIKTRGAATKTSTHRNAYHAYTFAARDEASCRPKLVLEVDK